MLTMCDYYGMCDEHGRCVGHPVKVTTEYGRILKGFGEDLRLVCSPCIADGVNGDGVFSDIVRLPYDISIVGNGIGKRIADKLKLFRNISIALKNTGTLFFYQVDFFFFLYLKLFWHKRPDKRIVILIYHQDFTGGRLGGILKKIYESALHKIDAVIYTQKGAEVGHENAVWMPDFIYRADEYEDFQSKPKTDRVVCLGTMSRYKQIEELIDVWRNNTALPPLIIAGRFDTEERFKALCSNIPDNVTIKNAVLEYDEYMELLSESRYSILPYDMVQYKNRTSGVLLESIYCGVIPIAPAKLLEQNMLPGLGYDSLSEVGIMITGDDGLVAASFARIYKEYGIDYAIDVLRGMLID